MNETVLNTNVGMKLRTLRLNRSIKQSDAARELGVSPAYLNLIEPWWKVLKSLALKGRRFQTWEEVRAAVEAATAYWNQHRHPFVWGRRRRHRPRRQPGIAAVPAVTQLAG